MATRWQCAAGFLAPFRRHGRGDLPLRPGAVFVIEPGAYFPEKGFGIRIEDTFAMREDGTLEVLSKDAPKARAEIERIRAEALATPTR